MGQHFNEARAHWLSADTIAWHNEWGDGLIYRLHYDPNGAIRRGQNGIEGGEAVELIPDPTGLSEGLRAKFPHLADLPAFKINRNDLTAVPQILQGQFAVSVSDAAGNLLDATSLQIPGVLDDLFTYQGQLGVIYEGHAPTLRLWAPTAKSVILRLFDDSRPGAPDTAVAMSRDSQSGVWSVIGDPDWTYKFYLYEVEVYVPETGRVENNWVTDPYSFSLSTNSRRSQIVNLADPALTPPGWNDLNKPPMNAPTDITLYELHVRDFSITDQTVPAAHRGTFMAFTERESNGMGHLRNLAAAGLSHIHLLPVFDIATINENKAERQEPDFDLLTSFPPDSEQQQAIIAPIRDLDGYNWGYDPYHFTVPEGSYATDPDGPTRIIEFRRMVQSLNQIGLRLVMDVVYNHTHASGQSEQSVLDRIVPGYYHRLDANGRVTNSTCCQNTATEQAMMEKLMIDSLVTWATAYKVDGFRFDLMGHHMVENMVKVRHALDGLTPTVDGVDGRAIYLYGEGWNFGEVANNARGRNAVQWNVGGLGIGTFNDRFRDAVRGGTPFAGPQEQGFANGLFVAPNGTDQGPESMQQVRLLHYTDMLRVGLAGNLRDYHFVNAMGERVAGSAVDYNGSPTGYTVSPQEQIAYVSAHDNETLFDAVQYKAPPEMSMADRVRMHNLAMSLVALAQGIPFFHAGDEMLRSKSLDRDSYNSGDWFNRLDFTYETNNWGVGLPPAESNAHKWPLMRPLLADPNLKPGRSDILNGVAHFQEMLQIRRSSPLFRLPTAEAVQSHLAFHNTGRGQAPGLIVMSLSDEGEAKLDPQHNLIVLFFNATPETISFTIESLRQRPLQLHPVQAHSNDPVVRTALFEVEAGTFTVPAWTTTIFVERVDS